MADFAIQNLWSDVVRRPANGAFFFSLEFQLSCQAEVSELELHRLVEEEIAELEAELDWGAYSR